MATMRNVLLTSGCLLLAVCQLCDAFSASVSVSAPSMKKCKEGTPEEKEAEKQKKEFDMIRFMPAAGEMDWEEMACLGGTSNEEMKCLLKNCDDKESRKNNYIRALQELVDAYGDKTKQENLVVECNKYDDRDDDVCMDAQAEVPPCAMPLGVFEDVSPLMPCGKIVWRQFVESVCEGKKIEKSPECE